MCFHTHPHQHKSFLHKNYFFCQFLGTLCSHLSVHSLHSIATMTHFLLFHHLLLACRSFPGIMQQSINCSNCSCFNAASKLTARIIFIKHRCGSTCTVHVHCTHLLVHARIPSPDTSTGNMRKVGLQGRQESTSSAPRGRNHFAPHFHTKPEMGMLIRKTPVLKLYADQIKLSVGSLSKGKIVCNL